MKMSIEWFVMMFIAMLFFEFGLSYMNIIMTHQNALELEEYAIMMIEHYNGYTDYVAKQINERTNPKMGVNISYEGGTYEVRVNYSVKAPFTHTILKNTVYSLTKD